MTFPVIDLADHPEADLLRTITRATELYDAADRMPRGKQKALEHWVKEHGREVVALDDKIIATRARTPEGIRAKMEYALRDADPEKANLGRGGCFGVAYSALWDVMAADV